MCLCATTKVWCGGAAAFEFRDNRKKEKRERISSRKIERVKRDFLQVSCKRITAIHSFIKTFFACVIYSKSENGWFQNIKRSFYYQNLQEAALGATQT